ncbi:MAG TPA: hypothetical protein VNL77_22725 [Roseiflexaceae bacterium]|nr:hypothetical protein [Roseiflexaceae bacterium]
MRFRPSYRLRVGSGEVDSRDDVSQSTLVRLEVQAAIDGLADRAELWLAPLGGLQPQLGDELEIDLGFEDSSQRVFTGLVAEVVVEVTAVRVVGHSPVQRLLGLRLEKTYERMTSGDIVRDLAGQAQVRTGVVEAGVHYPSYAIDGRLSAARHIHRLAERSGFDAYVLPDGALAFRAFTNTAPEHVFVYGQEILDYALSVFAPRAAEVVVAGESATSAQGADAASWLTRNFTRGRASGGRGPGTVLVEDVAMRTTEAANQRAEGVLRRLAQREKIGWLRALGRPELQLGDAFRVERAPDERLNDTFQARAVRHHLSRKLGLITSVEFWRVP